MHFCADELRAIVAAASSVPLTLQWVRWGLWPKLRAGTKRVLKL